MSASTLIRFLCFFCTVSHLSVGQLRATSISNAELQAMGRQAMQELRRDPGYLDDLLVNEYLTQIGKNLRRFAPTISGGINDVFVLADPAFNAFAMPGGYIGVNSGVLAYLDSEPQLAAVLAHEGAHVEQGHILRLLERNDATPWLLGAAILAAMLRGVDQTSIAGLYASQAVGLQGQLNFSREMEAEADRVGLRMLVGAGYPASAMVEAFQKLMRSQQFNDNTSFPFLRTHPLIESRITDLQARSLDASTAPVSQWPAYDFIRIRALILAAINRNQLLQLRQTLEQLGLSPAALRYAQAWLALLGNQAAQASSLLQTLDTAQLPAAAQNCVTLLQAELSTGSDQVKLLETAVRQHPSSLALRDAWVDSLIHNEQAAQAASQLRDWLIGERSQALWWMRLGQALDALGKPQAALVARAQALQLHGQTAEAVTLLKIALQTTPADPVETATIQSRLKEWERSDSRP